MMDSIVFLNYIICVALTMSFNVRTSVNNYRRHRHRQIFLQLKHDYFEQLRSSTQTLTFIEHRTQSCLDFFDILKTLENNTVTVLGAEMCKYPTSTNTESLKIGYSMVEQLYYEMTFLPMHTNMDVFPVIFKLENNLSPPESDELALFSHHIEQIVALREFLVLNSEKLSLFESISNQLLLPEEFTDIFVASFDEDNFLNGEKFPTIKQLRNQIENLRGKIVQIISDLLCSNNMKEKLSDSGFQEIDGRYCLLLKNTYKKGVGIVHGSSNTGRSLYVEPMEVVEPTNELKSVQAKLREEEAAILYELCRSISKHRTDIKKAVHAVAEIDVYRAKAKLGEMMKGVIPEVGDEGFFRCLDARHPILALRGKTPVGNDIHLNNTSSAWVISGPNAGGKTIVLKTAGLFALMVHYNIPIPAKRGARVDYLNVLADIGDMQTVEGDLSTFSGHLVVCREILNAVQTNSKKRVKSLVLLDEIGTGTDPAQGAALAQAVLEELISMHARVIVTTHYQRIKELAAEDERFQIAAMEFVDNKPTYKLRAGSVGESFAIETAKRMELPSNVLERANALLDDETRRIVALQQKLEQETNKALQKQREYDRLIQELTDQKSDIEKARCLLQQQVDDVRRGITESFVTDLKQRETDIEALLQQAKEVIFNSNTTDTEKTKIANKVKTAVKSMRLETEKELVEARAQKLATPLEKGEIVDVGRTLLILEKGALFGRHCIVKEKDKGRGRLVVSVAGMEVKIERHLLGHPLRTESMNLNPKDLFLLKAGGNWNDSIKNMTAKEIRYLKMLEEDLVDPENNLQQKSWNSGRVKN